MMDSARGSQYLDHGVGLLRQYELSNELSQLDEAIKHIELAAGLMPDGYADLPNTYAALVGARTQRFVRLSSDDDWGKARRAASEGLRRVAPASAGAPIWSNLAGLLRTVFQHTGRLEDLNESIDAARAAVRAWTESGAAIHPMTHATAAGSLMERFSLQQRIGDLSEAVEQADAALDRARPGHPARLSVLAIVVTAYRLHYEFSGAMRSLMLAVAYQQELAANLPAVHVESGTFLSTAAMTHLLRYDRLGSLSDIDAALANLHRAGDSPDAANYSKILTYRALALLRRAERFADAGRQDKALTDAQQAIEDAEAALEPARAQGAGLIVRQHIAANCWAMVARLTGDPEAAERARQHLETALASADPSLSARQTAAIALANLYLSNEHVPSTTEQVMDALGHLRTIVASATADDPIVRTAAASLIDGLLKSGTNDDEQTSELMDLLHRLAASGPTSAATVVAGAAQVGAALAQRGDARCAEAYDVALRLLPTAAWLGLDRDSQEKQLVALPGIARYAAAAYLARGAAGELDAVRALEEGRAVLWSHLIRLRSADPRLTAHPDLAEALAEVAGAITALNRETVGVYPIDDGASDRRMSLAYRWDELVEQARSRPGLADFLSPAPVPTLLSAASEGPVVLINVAPSRCDALIIRSDGIDVRCLPDLAADEVDRRTSGYLRTLHHAEEITRALNAVQDELRDDSSLSRVHAHQALVRTHLAASAEVEEMLRGLLAWLWDSVAGPVLDFLGYTGTPAADAAWPRVWWCPTGPLALLPLHAAGHHDESGRTVIDRVVSSYTPTIRALADARQSARATEEDGGRLLVVALPETEGLARLTGVTEEIEILAEALFRVPRTTLRDAEATRDAVRQRLRTHPWIHVSCHGGQNLHDPSRGGLELHDGTLTITDVGAEQYKIEFMALSACKTATGGVELLDESVTLTTALHIAGCRHVIGTLWSVRDGTTTSDVFRSLYRELSVDGRPDSGRSAVALHIATRAVRDAHRDRPSTWSSFTHTGP
jgi:tetratricopeptide (TPR) repeat protein